MSANIDSSGNVRQLDRRPDLDETITPDNVTDPKALARLLTKFFRIVVLLQRMWTPGRLDHQDRAVDGTGTTLYTFAHNLGGRVRWWVVDWTGSAGPQLVKDVATDDNTLVLRSYVAGTVTVRIEAAG
jgi:hypothetical protein